MKSIDFFVAHEPVAQPRQRFAVGLSKYGKLIPRAHRQTNHGIAVYKQMIGLAAKEKMKEGNHSFFSGPLRVDMSFSFSRPKRLTWKNKPMLPEWHTTKPDRDNLDKAVLDAMTGIVFVDDCQVCLGTIKKIFAGKYVPPGVWVRVKELGETEDVYGLS